MKKLQKRFNSKISTGLRVLTLKSVAVYTMVACLSMASPTVSADVNSDMADMFNNMGAASTYSASGTYSSQAANIYSGGGFSAKFGTKQLYPVNIQMPNVSAGCGGIDFFSGAFSFANKEQFIEFTRNLGNNAAGVAFEIGLDALDPLIGGAISKIRDVVNFINQNGINSCQAAKALVGGAAGKLGESIGKECELTANSDGTVDDNAEARWYCRSKTRLLNQRTKKLKEGLGEYYATAPTWFTGANGTQVQAPAGTGHVNKTTLAMTGGNTTLMALNKFPLDAEQKKWLLSIMGTTTVNKPPASDTDAEAEAPKAHWYEPTIKGDLTNNAFIDYFKKTGDGYISVSLYNCHEPNSAVVDPYKATQCDIETKTYQGFRKRVVDQIKILKDNLRTGVRATASNSAIIYKIVANSQLPVLKMALVDVRGNTNLTDKAADLIALQLAVQYLNELTAAARTASSMFESKDDLEVKAQEEMSKNAEKLLADLNKELNDSVARMNNESGFYDYVQKVERQVLLSDQNIGNSISFSKLLSVRGQ